MALNVTQKLIRDHLVDGVAAPGREIRLAIDQTLTQDATGTMVMLELEAMGVDRVRTELSAQYVDHNLVQEDHKNPDDHLFLRSACRRFGIWYSPPGNGVSHPVHQERFGRPGATLLGSDSHTPSAGAIGMLAMGAGGLEVAAAMAGEPYVLDMPEVWGVRLVGELPDWVSAKDVILEMLRRHGVDGAVGAVIEYFGPGLDGLSVMDRHVIANMGTELGATSTVFPSDGEVRRYLESQGRGDDWRELVADEGCAWDRTGEIDLGALEPLIAMPSSPGNVERVADQAGREVYQCYIGSSANPGYRDLAVAAEIVAGRRVHDRVSFDLNPASRQTLLNLMSDGHISTLVQAGARLHQAGCNGCIGMGQAPATGELSLRTVPRNFPGRSGTKEDQVCLVSPETAAASALTGVITDPRTLDRPAPRAREPRKPKLITDAIVAPLPADEAATAELRKGPNIQTLPSFDPLPDSLRLPVLLSLGDDVSTDEIMPAGARVLPFRSNIAKISDFCFDMVDETYPGRARQVREEGGHAIVAGRNYGQGSSREHAALAPRFLGLRAVLVCSFARIHRQNLVNFGVLPLIIDDPADRKGIGLGDVLELENLRRGLIESDRLPVLNTTRGTQLELRHGLSERQVEIILAGGLIRLLGRDLGPV
ncbi:MAG TPA: aconitate hydratase [Candidatus Sulfomarinibacteraceae bacterium]|nr:aconitate hydratase [Candidatus Sulfomarinibacteraceae bacterium]